MSGNNQGGLVGNLPTGVKLAAVGLLVHLLSKHSSQAAPSAEPAAPGGGLGGILGSIFGHGEPEPHRTAAPAAPVPTPAPEQGGLGGLLVGPVLGGLGGLLSALRGHGMGQQADSWVQPGQNRPVALHQLEKASGPGELDEAARRAGTDRGTLLEELSRMLPNVVDQATPGGKLPQREADLGGLFGRIFGDAPRR